jgi:FkbM family methyltransferase
MLVGAVDQRYEIGGRVLHFPADHNLPADLRRFRLDERKIGIAAEAVWQTHPDGLGIDVGANVGDTAAAIRGRCPMPLVCIEGDPHFYAYLERNAPAIDSLTTIQAVVGETTGPIHAKLAHQGGTSRLVPSDRAVEAWQLQALLMARDIDARLVRLLKVDTDGSDFGILLGAATWIARQKPSLFFEYAPATDADAARAILLTGHLARLGYHFVVFDNFGHTMRVIRAGAQAAFLELNRYLRSALAHGGGVVYADVFATPEPPVLDRFLALDAALVEGR